MIHGANDITRLLVATKDKDRVVRWFALEAIKGSIHSEYADEKDLVYIAENLLNDSDEYVRQAALDLLIGFGESSIEHLLQVAAKFAAGYRSWPAWEALWTLTSWVKAQGEAGIEALMKFVHGNDIELQDSALFVLGRIARFAAHRLVELLSDVNEDIRIGSLIALLELGEDTVPFLKIAVESKEEQTHTLAQQALDGLEKLRANEHLQMAIPSLRIARLTAIGGELALSALSKELRSANRKNRFMASKALAYIGQASVPTLISSLRSPDTDLRRRACEALRDIASSEARDALRDALHDPDMAVRQNAVRALTRIDNPNDLLAIRSLLLDPSRAVRRTAREAVGTYYEATKSLIDPRSV
jgi:HEAT repeat protein